MAFNTGSNAQSNNNGRNNGNDNIRDESWKAQGFLNLYLPSRNGGRRKLAGIPLKDSKPSEKELLAWLNEDPSRAQIILSKLEIEYQSALPSDATGFDLG